MKCPRCQQQNPPQAKFCLECATPLKTVSPGGPHGPSYAEVTSALNEALEQQTAMAEILSVISSSPTDVQPVFDAIARRSVELCDALYSGVFRYDGEFVHLAAHQNWTPEALAEFQRTYPLRPGRDATLATWAILDRVVVEVPDVVNDPGVPEKSRRLALARGYRSFLAVPMIREGQPIGAIAVAKREPRRFSDKQIHLLKTFADQAVIAIENVRLFTELQEKNRALTEAHAQVTESLEQQTATSEILRVISSSPTDVQPVFETIVRNAVRLCGAIHGGVYRFDGELIHSIAHEGFTAQQLEDWRRHFPRPLTTPGTGNIARAIATRSVERIADVEASDLGADFVANLRARGVRSTLSVPMLRRNEVIGVIGLTHRAVAGFSDAHVELLKTFADQAVIAIENARLFTELQQKNRALTESLEQQTATSEILRVISSSPTDLQPVLDAVAQSAARLCNANDALIYRLEGDHLELVAKFGQIPSPVGTLPLTRGLVTSRAVIDRQTLHIEDLATQLDEFPEAEMYVRRFSHRTILITPLLREGVALGAIGIRRTEVQPFSDSQIDLLKTFADQAVIAIDNVRLFTELQEKNAALRRAHTQVTETLEQQTATADILRVISQAQTDVQPVFEAIADSAMRLFGAWSVGVSRYDRELASLAATRGGLPGSGESLLAAQQAPHRPSHDTLPGRAVLTRAVQHVVDAATDPSWGPEGRRIASDRGFRSAVSVPMLRGREAVGAIVVTRAQPGGFSPTEIGLLQTFADQAVIAVENARLLAELRARTADLTRSVGQLTALGEVGQAVSSSLDLETVLTTIVSRAVELSGLDGGVIFEYDEAAEEFAQRAATDPAGALAEARRTARIGKGEGVVGRTAVTLGLAHVPDITVAGAYEGRLRETLIDAGVRAVLAVPMLREGHVIGCLAVTRNAPGDFPAETMELLRTFATQSALAIQNARLFHEIEDKSRQLEAASRHKSEFLANMSHELRTPLNAIIGFSEVLGERMFGELNAKQEEYLKDIHASGQHLLSLINDILDLSKIEAGRMDLELTDFHLPATLDNALTLVRERGGRHGIGLHMTVDDRVEHVRADERKIKQVILNLLSNAIKFTPEGGRIDVRALPGDGVVEVSVRDTGVGIAPEDQEAIFEEFRQVGTAAKRVEGTGLGLALSRKFIELHGGRIWVESQVGVGSTFTFTIPVRRGE